MLLERLIAEVEGEAELGPGRRGRRPHALPVAARRAGSWPIVAAAEYPLGLRREALRLAQRGDGALGVIDLAGRGSCPTT